MVFYQAAIESSSKYYAYLSDNGKGVIETKIKQIDVVDEGIALTISGKLRMPDQVQVKIHSFLYTQDEIKPLSYDEGNRVLIVRPLEELRYVLLEAEAKDVSLIADMRFLVKRVEEWYQAYGTRLQMPVLPPHIEYKPQNKLEQQPSDEQTNAIIGALSSPFSYIWGAPGTGKTQFVLARCIISCLLSNQHVLITAPTNNAVEQMLNGILSVLEDAEIPLDKILRLGIPSKSFYEEYPTVCENAAIEKLLSQIDKRIRHIDEEIEVNNHRIELFPHYMKHLDFVNGIARCKEEAPEIFENLKHCKQELSELSDLFEVNTGKITVLQAKIPQVRQEYSVAANEIKNINAQLKKYNSRIKKRLFHSKVEAYIAELSEKIALTDSLSDKIAELQNEIEKLCKKQEEITAQKRTTTEKANAEISKLRELTQFCWELYEAIRSISVETSSEYHEKYEVQIAKGMEIVKKNSEEYSFFEGVTKESLMEKREKLQQERGQCVDEKKRLKGSGTDARLAECLVVAATIDTCLYRVTLDDKFIPEHIFLDEAGYCSLIKVGTLFAYGCPITLLGDHMQLPPVCEMDDDTIAFDGNLLVALWAQSALYAEDIFVSLPQEVCSDYLIQKPASFQRMVKYDLTHSFRFGESLAAVLSSLVYQNNFHGDSNHNTDIFYIKTKKVSGKKERTNFSECRAIKTYVDFHPDENIGIITPYKNQRAEIKTMFRKTSLMDDEIVTVHGSQGREWDTVLFSVVDVSNKWFTDSLNEKSNGKNVINTAVSRAKKKLIIVCDVDKWITQKEQLIGQLLSIAQEITNTYEG